MSRKRTRIINNKGDNILREHYRLILQAGNSYTHGTSYWFQGQLCFPC